ncbi:MAG: isoprenoid biosynthesis glyoxalase ElbB [Myxococcota bacterium]
MGKIAVCLSGCGVKDGSEIHEATAALWAITKYGHSYQCIAPDKPQHYVINHLKDEPVKGETRNILAESARIARGNILSLSKVNADDYDALVFPGGLGAALNLCNFAQKGEECDIDPDVEKLILSFHEKGKPICAICIAPSIVARAFKGRKSVTLTIGNDAATAAKLQKMGARHQKCPVTEAYTDKENKIITTPAYMLATSIGEVFTGVEAAIKALCELL